MESLTETGNQLTGAAIGLGVSAIENKMQRSQNKKLMRQQIEGSQEMAKFNQGLALDTWNKTNFEAQRKHLEAAGLNVGLMYGMGGAGGATASTPGGSVSTATAEGRSSAGMGMQLALQAQMTAAQTELIKAQTRKTETETTKTAGVDTQEATARIEQIKQLTKNAKVQAEIANYEKALKEIEANIADKTEWDIIKQATLANWKLEGEARSAMTKGEIDQKTQDEIIKQIEQNTQEQMLRMQAQKLGLIKTDADTKLVNQSIQKLVNDINIATQGNMREWDKMTQANKELFIKQKIADSAEAQMLFNTSTPAQIKQWVDIIGGVIQMTPGAPAKKIGF